MYEERRVSDLEILGPDVKALDEEHSKVTSIKLDKSWKSCSSLCKISLIISI